MKKIIIGITLLVLVLVFALSKLLQHRYQPYITSQYFLTTFSDEYIQSYKNEVDVVIPEVFELLYVMIALSDDEQLVPGLIQTNTPYYDLVMSHFSEHRNHPSLEFVVSAIKNTSITLLATVFAL